MADVSRRRTGEFVKNLLEILQRHPDGLQAAIVLQELEKTVTLTTYEAGNYESGTRRFEKIVRFATVDCVKAGWIIKHKGTWSITEEGRQAYKKFSDPEALYREAVRLYRAWKKTQPTQDQPDTADPDNGPNIADKSAAITLEQADEQAWGEIERHLREMEPYDFQKLIAGLLSAMGYHISWISPRGKDGGVDIIAHTDPLGINRPRIKVQVKRWATTVDTEGLRAFLATINDDDVGIFVCTGGFTKDAKDHARNQERRKITLIDSERLVDLWIEYYKKLDDEARQRLPLRPIYFLTSEDN